MPVDIYERELDKALEGYVNIGVTLTPEQKQQNAADDIEVFCRK
jgi:hypothetical protein